MNRRPVHQQPVLLLQRRKLSVGHAHIAPDEVFQLSLGVLFGGDGGEGSAHGLLQCVIDNKKTGHDEVAGPI